MTTGIYNVRDFGAKGDGVTDDGSAFFAAMEAMGPVTALASRHGTLLVPAGDYFFAEDLKIERAIKMVGVGPGAYQSKSRLIFAPYKGLRVYSQGPRDGNGNYATIEDLDILCGNSGNTALAALHHPVWLAGHLYHVGDKVLPAKSRKQTRVSLANARLVSYNNYDPGFTWEYYYECVSAAPTGSTSGSEEPHWSLVQAIDQSEEWEAGADYYYHSVVRAPGRFDVYFTPAGPTFDHTFPRTPDPYAGLGPRRSGSSIPPEFATARPGEVVREPLPDGTPDNIIWHCRSTGSVPPLWQSGRTYAANARVRSATRTDVVFVLEDPAETEAVILTGTAEPAAFATAIAEQVIPEGVLQWRCSLDSDLWQPGEDFAVGNVIRTQSRDDVFFRLEAVANGPTTVSGYTGAVEPPTFLTAKPGDLIDESGLDPHSGITATLSWRCQTASWYFVGDGRLLSDTAGDGPVWACRVAAGVFAQARVTLNRVSVRDALTAGFHAQASADFLPASNANGFSIYDFRVTSCGCGIVTRGGDCNASLVVNADIALGGKNDKAVGIADRSFLGIRCFACQVVNAGPAYLAPSRSNTGGLYGCYAEGGLPSEILPAGYMVFGGTYNPGFDQDGGGWVLENRNKIPPFNIVHPGEAGASMETYLGYAGDAVLGWSASGDSAYWLLWWDTKARVWRTQRGAAQTSPRPASYLTDKGYWRTDAVFGLQGFPEFLLGDPEEAQQAIKISRGSAPTGAGIKGDIVFNTEPDPDPAKDNHFIGWVYCEGATPGWKRFGKIEP